MSEKIKISTSKTLKLTNVIKKEIILSEVEDPSFIDVEALRMENYIKAKGSNPLGPIIQHIVISTNEMGEQEVKIEIMRQASSFINRVESPYKSEPLIRTRDCMYARFKGDETKLKFGYDKLNVMAFEDDILLTGNSYTIYLDNRDGVMMADIFMEKVDHE